MIKALKKPPKSWLTLGLCKILFEQFKHELEFDEPIPPFETRFPGKLEGILASIQQTFDKKLLNPTLLNAAVAYFHQLILGHPFQNGNKRMALLFTHAFLLLHNMDFSLTQKELFALTVFVAESTVEKTDVEIKEFIQFVFQEKISSYR